MRYLVIGVLLLSAQAGPPKVTGVEAAVSGSEARVSARLDPALPGDVERRLASGLPTSTTWRIALRRRRGLLPDVVEAERRYEVTATYRPASADFTIERRLDSRLLETAVVPERAEALRALSRLSSVPCFTLGSHLAGQKLAVAVRCAYARGVTLGVVPTTVETDWQVADVSGWKSP